MNRRTVIALLNDRNELHRKFQEKLEALGAKHGTLEGLPAIAGLVLSKHLQQITDDLYDLTEDAVTVNGEVITNACKVFKRLYPKGCSE